MTGDKRSAETQKRLLAYIKTEKGTKCIKGIFKQKIDDPVLWSIVDYTGTVYKPLKECRVLTAAEKRKEAAEEVKMS